MNHFLLVSLGAALGGALRYWMSNAVHKIFPAAFPYGTLSVNVIGSFLLGVIMFYFSEKNLLSDGARIFLTIGFCGGFTTFSTFSYETIALLRDSQYLTASFNVILNVVLCTAVMAGAYFISKVFL